MTADLLVYQDEFIQIFRFLRSTDEAVELWAAELESYIQNMPQKEPFFILLDVSGDKVGFTARARQHSKRIFNQYRMRKGYIAMLFEWRTSPYFGRLFFASLGKLSFKLNYFHQLEDAQNWLQQMHRQETG